MSSTVVTEAKVYVESTRVRILKAARVLHLYIGAFISPAILFFRVHRVAADFFVA